MCDYSLQHIKSRAAKVDDRLVTSTFDGTPSRGFAGVGEPNTAVCLLPGTEIAFAERVRYGASGMYSFLSPSKQTKSAVARFRQVNKENLHMHHDALEFPDGQIVMLHDLVAGQVATVLQLPAAPKTETETDEQRRVEVVA